MSSSALALIGDIYIQAYFCTKWRLLFLISDYLNGHMLSFASWKWKQKASFIIILMQMHPCLLILTVQLWEMQRKICKIQTMTCFAFSNSRLMSLIVRSMINNMYQQIKLKLLNSMHSFPCYWKSRLFLSLSLVFLYDWMRRWKHERTAH